MEENVGFDITTEDIVRKIGERSEKSKTPKSLRKINKIITEIQNYEKNLISKYDNYYEHNPLDIIQSLPSLDLELLKLKIKNNFYSSELMKLVSLICHSLNLYISESNISNNDRIREYLINLRRIGTESAYGVAITADLSEVSNFCILKAAKNDSTKTDLIHELAIAYECTNKLREYVPNFAMIYGMYSCSSPYVSDNENREVLSWCISNEMPVDYVIYEKINGISIDDYCRICSEDEFLNQYLQIMFALRLAQQKYAYSHNDLHSENVMLRESDKTVYIRYESGMGVVYLKSKKYIATMIDYGMSYAQHYDSDGNLVILGSPSSSDLSAYGVYKNSPNPIMDVYKLLCMCLATMLSFKNSSFNKLSQLLRFFNKSEEPLDIILRQNQERTYYCLHYDKSTDSFRIDEWIDYILDFMNENNIPLNLYKKPSRKYETLYCGGSCQTLEDQLKSLNYQEYPIPKNYFQFNDSVVSLVKKCNNQDFCKNKISEFISNFNYLEHFDSEKQKIKKIMSKLQDFNPLKIPTNLNLLFNDNILNSYKAASANFVSFYDNYKRLELHLKIGQFVDRIYNDTTLKTFYKKLEKSLNFWRTKILRCKNMYEEDIKRLKTPEFLQQIKNNNPKYKWYLDTYSKLLEVTLPSI